MYAQCPAGVSNGTEFLNVGVIYDETTNSRSADVPVNCFVSNDDGSYDLVVVVSIRRSGSASRRRLTSSSNRRKMITSDPCATCSNENIDISKY